MSLGGDGADVVAGFSGVRRISAKGSHSCPDSEIKVGSCISVSDGEDVDRIETVTVVAEDHLRLAEPTFHGVCIRGDLSLQSDPIQRCQQFARQSGRHCLAARQRLAPSLSQ